MDEQDEFGSDDGLDLLPANTLAQLEHDAFVSTQRHKSASEYGERSRNVVVPHYDRPIARRARAEYPKPPSDYGFDDEEIVDLDSFPQDDQRAHNQWPQPPRILDHGQPYQQPQSQHYENSVDVDELQQRIRELEATCANLQQTSVEAQTALQSKTGENAVLRQRMDKTTRENEQKLATMRALHNEASAKIKAELETIKRDKEKIATDNQFLTHDIAIEAGRQKQSRRLQQTEKKPARPSPLTTPKKDRTLPFRDGFDDDDIMMPSPSRSRNRSKTSTPSNANKRKRNVEDQSPIKPLLIQSFGTSDGESPSRAGDKAHVLADPETLHHLAAEQGQLGLTKRLFDRRFQGRGDQDRVMEVLTRHNFPSQPNKALSSVVYDTLTTQACEDHPQGFSGLLCDTFLDLWDQCLKKNYHGPINLLVDTLQFLLMTEFFTAMQHFTARAVPLAMATCDLIAIPLARESLKQSKGQSKSHSTTMTAADEKPAIDVEACLQFLSVVVQACAMDSDAIVVFWKHMKFDFVLLMLMRAQPLPQIFLMLRLLRSSILPLSFGAITDDDSETSERRRSRESDTVNRLSLLLFEKFTARNSTPVQGQQKSDEAIAKVDEATISDGETESMAAIMLEQKSILELRLEILSIFLTLCTTTHGTTLLSTHKYALGRLVRSLHNSVSELYHYSLLMHDLHIAAVNGTMRIVHHIITCSSSSSSPDSSPALPVRITAPPIDVREKLRVIPGGAQMWLVALTRLAFMEGLLAEEGISAEASDMAHQLLDEYLSPDEGEALLEVFGGSGMEAA